MARYWSDLGDSQLQVGARLKKGALFLVLALAISGSSAEAATKKPTPIPTAKATAKTTAKTTVKATAKATVKSTAKATTKPTAKTSAKPTSTSKSTAKPTSTTSAKPTVKPKPRPKPKPRKKISVSPSPKAAWPPAGFAPPESGIYAKVPNSKELVGVISAKGNLATQVAACAKFVCGAVQVAAEQGCLWWEVESKVYAQNKELLGTLKTITNGSTSREIKTILLITPEALESLEYVDNIDVICHQEVRPEGLQAVTYTKAG
jgi:hypothetical protein